MWLYVHMFIPNKSMTQEEVWALRQERPPSTIPFLLQLSLSILTRKMRTMPRASWWCCKAYKGNCRCVLSRRHGEHSWVPSLPLGQTVRCPWNPIHRISCALCVIMSSANTSSLWVTLGCPTAQLAFLRPALGREGVGVSGEWPSHLSVPLLGYKQLTALGVPKEKGKALPSFIQQVVNLLAQPSPVTHHNLMLDPQPTGSREWDAVLTHGELAFTRPVDISKLLCNE